MAENNWQRLCFSPPLRNIAGAPTQSVHGYGRDLKGEATCLISSIGESAIVAVDENCILMQSNSRAICNMPVQREGEEEFEVCHLAVERISGRRFTG